MKKLMLGNEAVARGLYEAGVSVVSSYPGTPSTEITEYASTYPEIYSEWAPNEKVAVEAALGASIAGRRSFSGMKHVGLNVAADPLFTSSYTGVNGGVVIAVADDPGMHSSQNEQDSRHYARAAKIPMLEPSDSAECLRMAKLAYELSERYDTPVLLRLTTRVAHSRSVCETGEREERAVIPYKKDVMKYVMMPAMARGRHVKAEERMKELGGFAETFAGNTVEINNAGIGIITSGISYQYAKEALGVNANYLKLGMVWPLPVKLIKDFAAAAGKIYVIEELDDFLETHCRKYGVPVIGKELFPVCGELSQAIVREKLLGETKPHFVYPEPIPARPPVFCPGCSHRGVFQALKDLDVYISGDIGCYSIGATAPYHAMDSVICMGASVSGLHGYNKALGSDGEKKAVAVIGDSTFIHSGITGLIDIVYNQSNSVVIILDNSITGMTGHQENPSTGYNIHGDPTAAINMEALCKALSIDHVRVVDPYKKNELYDAVKEELAYEGPSVIIVRRPCILIKNKARKNRPSDAVPVNADRNTDSAREGA